jgi:hypothetical protein
MPFSQGKQRVDGVFSWAIALAANDNITEQTIMRG